jgi:hypothetical protein
MGGSGVRRGVAGVMAVIAPAVVAVSVTAVLTVPVGATPAFAESECASCRPWWHLSSGIRPAYLYPDVSGAEIIDTTIDLGNGPTDECVHVAPGAGKFASSTCETELGAGKGEFEKEPVIVVDELPAGLQAVSASVIADAQQGDNVTAGACSLSSRQRVQCTLESSLAPFAQVEVRIGVIVEAGARTGQGGPGEDNEVSVSGGAAPPLAIKRPIAIGAAQAPFGVEDYELTPEEAGGTLDTRAGSHPFQLTATFTVNQTAGGIAASAGPYEASPVALAKDLSLRFPAGLIGNPTPLARCTLVQLVSESCSARAVLGVATVTVDKPGILGLATIITPVFNLEPAPGEPARFGFLPLKQMPPVLLDTSVRTGADYGITVSIENISEDAALISGTVTLWGVPGDSGHDRQRGSACLDAAEGAGGVCELPEESSPPPFLSLPASCTGPLRSSAEADSWERPGNFFTGENIVSTPAQPMPALNGCNRLPFSPEIEVSPEERQASTPSGFDVDVHVNQEGGEGPEAVASSPAKDIMITLPAGVALNPAAANGLEACSEAQVGFEGVREFPTEPGVSNPVFAPYLAGSIAALAAGEDEPLQPGVNFCPQASKIANVKIKTPLVADLLEGAVYLASPQSSREGPGKNPFGSLGALYVVAEESGSGVLVKLPGQLSLDQRTGQITVTFQNTPQLPFEDIDLHFFGEDLALLSTPARCGSYETVASFVPWSAEPGEAPHTASSTFDITSGPNGSPCPGFSLRFAPSMTAGTASIQAGGYSPLTVTVGREDGQQALQGLQLRLPPGLSAMLSTVPLCHEAQASAGTCTSATEIGQTTVSAGLGADPYTLTGGRVYLTDGYDGAPFGLSIITPVKAGPLDLEDAPENHPPCDCLVIRAKVEVDAQTAQLTITTGTNADAGGIPTIVEGFPLQIKDLNITIDRLGFMFNPTSCDPMKIEGAIAGDEGAQAQVSSSFQTANCAKLKFKPRFEVSTSGKTSRSMGASLHVKLSYPNAPLDQSEIGQQANLASVKVDLPKQLVSRLATLGGACLASVFDRDPATCPASSRVGTAKVTTPVLPVSLEGPAYFVSHGGARFPELVLALQRDGVRIDLHGETFIDHAGITSSTFRAIPDVPVGTFELSLPEGPYSVLAANGKLCAKTKSVTVKERVVLERGGRVVRRNGKTVFVTRRVKKRIGGLVMPTALTAQNGAVIHQNTPVAVTGCPRAKPTKKANHDKKGKEKT